MISLILLKTTGFSQCLMEKFVVAFSEIIDSL